MSKSLSLITDNRFLPVCVTHLLGAFNDNLFRNAFLIWYAFDYAPRMGHDSSLTVSLMAAIFISPYYIFSGLAGELADKYQRATLAQRIKLAEICIAIFAGVMFVLESHIGLMFVLFLLGTQSAFYSPITYSMLRLKLNRDELVSGNALFEGGLFAAILLGTMVGGLVVAGALGTQYAGMAMVCIALLGWMTSRFMPHAELGNPGLTVRANPMASTAQMVRIGRSNRRVWRAIMAITWFWMFGITTLSQVPLYGKEVLHIEREGVTLMMIVITVGVAIGSLWAAQMSRGKVSGKPIPYGIIGASACTLIFCALGWAYPQPTAGSAQDIATLLANYPPAYGVMLALLGMAVSMGLYAVPLLAILQDSADTETLSRSIAANNIVNAIGMALASVMAVLIYAAGGNVLSVLATFGVLNLALLWYCRAFAPSTMPA